MEKGNVSKKQQVHQWVCYTARNAAPGAGLNFHLIDKNMSKCSQIFQLNQLNQNDHQMYTMYRKHKNI